MQTVADPGAVMLHDLAVLEVEVARAEGRRAAKMLEFDDLRRRESEWTDNRMIRKLEVSFAAEELGAVQRMSGYSAQVRLAEARRVRGLLPETWAAHLRGEIDGWRVRLIASTVYSLVEPESLVKLDAEVVTVAAKKTATQTKAWLRRFVARVEPDHQVKRTKRGLADRPCGSTTRMTDSPGCTRSCRPRTLSGSIRV